MTHVSLFGWDLRHLWVTPFLVDNKTEDFTFRIPWSCCHWCLRIDPRVRVWTLRWSSDCSWKASCIKCWPSDVAGPGEDEQVMSSRNSWCKMRHSFMRHLQIDHLGTGNQSSRGNLEELGSCEIRLALDGGFAILLRPLVPEEALVDNNTKQDKGLENWMNWRGFYEFHIWIWMEFFCFFWCFYIQ